MRRALYARVGSGYREAVIEAMNFLGAMTFHEPRRTTRKTTTSGDQEGRHSSITTDRGQRVDHAMSTDAPNEGGRTLYDQTSRLAGAVAARSIGSRYEKILRFLRERGPGGGTLFEVAAHLGLFDHQISGRFTELQKDGKIVRTGQTRTKPETGCECDVWALREPREGEGRRPDLGDEQGYPVTLQIPGDGLFHRAPVLEKADVGGVGSHGTPGIPYVLDTRAAGTGLRLAYRVELIGCGGCGRPLKKIIERGKGEGGKDRITYRCGVAGCNRVWHLLLVHEPGGAETLALVMKGF